MADLYTRYERSPYYDRQSGLSNQEYHETIEKSTCLYVGNLSYYTTENQIVDFFSRAGEVKRVVMGLDRVQKTPCGFCFVEYYASEDTEAAVRYLNNLRLDDRQIRLDRDPGFKEGRQYGRGKSGGQVRDEYRMDFDLGRGGFGRVIQEAGSVDVGSAQNAFGGDRFSGGGRERGGRDWERREGGRERSRERSRERGRDGERELPVRGEHEIDDRKGGREEDVSDDEGRGRRRRGSESD